MLAGMAAVAETKKGLFKMPRNCGLCLAGSCVKDSWRDPLALLRRDLSQAIQMDLMYSRKASKLADPCLPDSSLQVGACPCYRPLSCGGTSHTAGSVSKDAPGTL